MLFNSWQFLVFFPVVTLLFFLQPPPHRRWWLLVASSVFYMAFIPQYILIIFALVLLTYVAARLIEPAQGPRRRWYLILNVAGTLGMLAVFKYFNFFNHNVHWLAAALGIPYTLPDLALVLPIGLSFQTLQSLAYTFEVYYGRCAAERSLSTCALYVLFYPQLVAGPIERPQNLLPQLTLAHQFDADRLTGGLKLMAWGLFKKMVLADRLALIVGTVYAKPADFTGPQLLLATALFSFQIYYDFSGYTDVARGAALTMGMRLRTNFNRPYAARFVGDFWGRWHLSLTSWFRDYVYAPLAGPRPRRWRRALAIGIVFLLSGLWHGAAWTFVVWGGLHAIYLIVGTATARRRARLAQATGLARLPRLHASLRVVTTFSLVSLSWICFRAADLSDALLIVGRLGTGWSSWTAASVDAMGIGLVDLRHLVSVIAIVEVVSWLDQREGATIPLAGRWAPLRAVAYVAIVVGILEFGVAETVPFIYAQF